MLYPEAVGYEASIRDLDEGMPLDQVQKFLRHKRITTTQIYAETSLHRIMVYCREKGGYTNRRRPGQRTG